MKFKNRNWQEEVIPLQSFKTQFHPFIYLNAMPIKPQGVFSNNW